MFTVILVVIGYSSFIIKCLVMHSSLGLFPNDCVCVLTLYFCLSYDCLQHLFINVHICIILRFPPVFWKLIRMWPRWASLRPRCASYRHGSLCQSLEWPIFLPSKFLLENLMFLSDILIKWLLANNKARQGKASLFI